MKRIFLLLFAFGLLITAKAQTVDTENTILQNYQIKISGATNLETAKELGTYDYMEVIFGARPLFDDETDVFTVKSYEIVSLDQLSTKLNENGLTVAYFNQVADNSQPK